MNTKLPENIKDDDFLGRAIFSSKQARSPIRYIVFMEKLNKTLSMDRFDFCPLEKLIIIQDQNAKKRSTQDVTRFFYGWAKLKALSIKQNGRVIKSTPTSENLYHADILLPENISRDTQIGHAKELAANSEWMPK